LPDGSLVVAAFTADVVPKAEVVGFAGNDVKSALAGSQHRGLVVFNCILRTLEMKDQGITEAFGKLFTRPSVGFSTYGEAYIGHINQTATILPLR
jgi:hypothetical protein